MNRTPPRYALLLATLLLPAITWGGPASGTGVASEDEEPAVATACDSTLAGLQEAACDDADELPDIEELLASYGPAAQGRVAGHWIDRSVTPSVQRISVVGLTASDTDLLGTLTGSDSRVVAVPANFSTAQLESFLDSVRTLLVNLNITQFDLGISQSANRVEVGVPNALVATVLQQAGDLMLPAGALSVTGGFGGVAPVATRNTATPHAGGLALLVSDNEGTYASGCTSGFSVKNSSGDTMGLTAGHCSRNGALQEKVYVGSTYISHSGMNTLVPMNHGSYASSDAMRYSVPAIFKAAAKIYTSDTAPQYRNVTSPRYTMTTLQEGVKVCFQGKTSENNNCGYVKETDREINYTTGQKVRHMFSLTHSCAGGDSGGPVYHVNGDGTAKPAGLMAAGTPTTNCWFSQIGYALSDTDTAMMYAN